MWIKWESLISYQSKSHLRVKALNRWGRVMHICVSNLTIIGSDNGLSPDRRQALTWTNAEFIVNWTHRNKLQSNLNSNSNIFIQENAFENVICQMVAIFSLPQWVNMKHADTTALMALTKCQHVLWCNYLERPFVSSFLGNDSAIEINSYECLRVRLLLKALLI